MLGLLKAVLLSAPILASAFVVPDAKINNINDATSWTIFVKDDVVLHDLIPVHVEVFPSLLACGYGNVTINGQKLDQTSHDKGSSGNGLVKLEDHLVSATWDFQCVEESKDEPAFQIMTFNIDSIDQQPYKGVVFSVKFRQAPVAQIIPPPPWSETPLLEEHQRFPNLDDEENDNDSPLDFENFNLEAELEQLAAMKAHLMELEYHILQKEMVIREAIASHEFDESIGECDSLKCLLKTSAHKLHQLAENLKHKISALAGMEDDDSEDGHWKPPHWRKPPHWKKPHHPGKHGNHSHHNKTCHRPHRNHSHHHHPPHWRKPHFKLPPHFCHPPPHHGPPHHGPPHHGPPHGKPPHEKPPHGKPPHGPPPPEEIPGDDAPDFLRRPHHGDRPSNLPLFGHSSSHSKEDESEGHPRPPFDGRRPGHHFNHRRPGWLWALHALKFIIIGVLLAFFVRALHRCCLKRKCKGEKHACRAERRRRRASRRAAHKEAWKAWISRRFRYQFSETDSEEYEEKYGSFTPLTNEDDDDDMASTITELRSAAGVVSDMVAAEEGRAVGRMSMESRMSRGTTLPDYTSVSEHLPLYGLEDGSEESSIVADGFRYSPGSNNSPALSVAVTQAGSVRDVLGDTKD